MLSADVREAARGRGVRVVMVVASAEVSVSDLRIPFLLHKYVTYRSFTTYVELTSY